jgi:hypothetical protein
MKTVMFIVFSTFTHLLFSCGQSEGNKKSSQTPNQQTPLAPDTSTEPEVFSSDFKKKTEASLVECQQSYRFSTNCRLKDGAHSLVLSPASAPAKVKLHTVTIMCHAADSTVDFGFRLRADADVSPVVVQCRNQEPHTYTLRGSGDLELFVEKPDFLKALLVTINFVLEVKTISTVEEE